MNIAQKTTFLRNHLGITSANFALRCGYSAPYLRQIETYKHIPDEEFLITVAKVFCISLDWLKDDTQGEAEFTSNNENVITPNQRVRMIRQETGLTLAEFAFKIGGDQATLSKIENGKNPLTLRMAKRIEKAYNVGSSWILYGEERNRYCPVGEEMIEYLKDHPDLRYEIRNRMDKEQTED